MLATLSISSEGLFFCSIKVWSSCVLDRAVRAVYCMSKHSRIRIPTARSLHYFFLLESMLYAFNSIRRQFSYSSFILYLPLFNNTTLHNLYPPISKSLSREKAHTMLKITFLFFLSLHLKICTKETNIAFAKKTSMTKL